MGAAISHEVESSVVAAQLTRQHVIDVSRTVLRTPDPGGVWRWSRWRRRRQYQARLCHYRQRGYALT